MQINIDSKLFEADLMTQVDRRIFDVVGDNASEVLAEMAKQHFAHGGKKLRSRIALSLAVVLDAPASKILGWAAACELFHNGTLVHDDLQDGDSVRRGQPAIWKTFGAAQAINLGDCLMLIGPQAWKNDDLTDKNKAELALLYSQLASAVIQGQSLEFSFKDQVGIRELGDDYRRCITLKTAALFAKLAKGVALIAGCGEDDKHDLEKAFENFGIMFQIQDDILDLFGDKGRESVGCDVKEGKISALVVKLLERCPVHGTWLRAVLQKDRDLTTIEDIQLFKHHLEESGTLLELALDLESLETSILGLDVFHKRPAAKVAMKSLLETLMTPIRHIPQMNANLN